MSRSTALRRPVEASLLRRFLAAAQRALHLRLTRHHLARLDPHLLRDIGLTPEEAALEASRPLWDAPEGWFQRD